MAKIGEGAISSGLGRFFDILVIGILTFVCSLPVITMGAAITAAYDVYIRMALDKDSHVVSTYFRAFGKNFLKATIIHLIVLVAAAFVGASAYLFFFGVHGLIGTTDIFVDGLIITRLDHGVTEACMKHERQIQRFKALGHGIGQGF